MEEGEGEDYVPVHVVRSDVSGGQRHPFPIDPFLGKATSLDVGKDRTELRWRDSVRCLRGIGGRGGGDDRKVFGDAVIAVLCVVSAWNGMGHADGLDGGGVCLHVVMVESVAAVCVS